MSMTKLDLATVEALVKSYNEADEPTRERLRKINSDALVVLHLKRTALEREVVANNRAIQMRETWEVLRG